MEGWSEGPREERWLQSPPPPPNPPPLPSRSRPSISGARGTKEGGGCSHGRGKPLPENGVISKVEGLKAIRCKDPFGADGIGEYLASWHRSMFYPYLTPHITKPKDSNKMYIVPLSEKAKFGVSGREGGE